MKKHLIATAVVAALAAPAMAQNVTLSGVIDAGFGAVDRGGAADPDQGYLGFVAGAFATNQLNIMGTEDLGGGLKAGFKIQRQFSPATGLDSGVTNGSNAAGVGFDEVSVNLAGAFGTVSLGKQDMAGRELGGIGRFGNFGRTTGFTRIGDERDGVINYTSPSFSGLQVSVGYAAEPGSGFQSAASQFGKSTSAALTYSSGPFKIGAAMSNGDYQSAAGGSLANQTKAKDTIVAVEYNAGFATFGLVNATSDLDKNSNANSVVGKRSVTAVAANVPLGNGLSLLGSIMNMKNNGESSDNKARGYQVALTKDLSKRTTVYAIYSSVTNDAEVSFATRGMVAPAANGQDPSAALIGVRHTF